MVVEFTIFILVMLSLAGIATAVFMNQERRGAEALLKMREESCEVARLYGDEARKRLREAERDRDDLQEIINTIVNHEGRPDLYLLTTRKGEVKPHVGWSDTATEAAQEMVRQDPSNPVKVLMVCAHATVEVALTTEKHDER